MSDKLTNSKDFFKNMPIGYLLFPVVFCFCFYVILDQIGTVDYLKNEYHKKRLEYDIQCHGNATWLTDVAKMTIELPNRNGLDNVSLSYLSPNHEKTTCTTGWYDELGKSQHISEDTVYLFASLTKVFTSDLTLALIRDGKLNFDDKLVKLLPELTNKKFKDPRVKDITVEDLLSHTAGFDRLEKFVNDNMFQPNPWCPSRVEELSNIELQFAPEEKFAYSNTGYCLLSRVAEVKYNQPFRELVRDKYALHNYKNFDFIDADKLPKTDSAIKPLEPTFNYSAISSVAGLYGNASDLAEIIFQINKNEEPNIISRSTKTLCDNNSVAGCHGYMGFEYAPNPNLKFYWRDGNMPDVAGLFVIDDDGGVLVVLTNSVRDSDDVHRLVKDIYSLRLKLLNNKSLS